jgi:hypothetical protein
MEKQLFSKGMYRYRYVKCKRRHTLENHIKFSCSQPMCSIDNVFFNQRRSWYLFYATLSLIFISNIDRRNNWSFVRLHSAHHVRTRTIRIGQYSIEGIGLMRPTRKRSRWLSKDCQPGCYENGPLLRTKEIWIQKEITQKSPSAVAIVQWVNDWVSALYSFSTESGASRQQQRTGTKKIGHRMVSWVVLGSNENEMKSNASSPEMDSLIYQDYDFGYRFQ